MKKNFIILPVILVLSIVSFNTYSQTYKENTLAVSCKPGDAIMLHKGIYFDNDAEGFVDSIFIGLSGNAKEIEDNLDELMAIIKLPDHRYFEIISYRYYPDGIAVNVNETAPIPGTYVTDKDVLEVKDTVYLQAGGWLLPTSAPIQIIDSIAPLIMSASFIDSIVIIINNGQIDSLTDLGTDELTVIFSETVEDITKDKPFKYYATKGAKEYGAELSLLTQNENMGRFSVEKLFGAESIVAGDSIWINWALNDNVYDAIGNEQDNPDNVRKSIEVILILDTIIIIDTLITTVEDDTTSACGDCGSGSGLAFIPPIGLKIASMFKRRKKWWYNFLKWLKTKILLRYT